MKISKIAKQVYQCIVISFLFYLAYASTLYMKVMSFSFFLVLVTASVSSYVAFRQIERITEEVNRKNALNKHGGM